MGTYLHVIATFLSDPISNHFPNKDAEYSKEETKRNYKGKDFSVLVRRARGAGND